MEINPNLRISGFDVMVTLKFFRLYDLTTFMFRA